MFPPSCGFFPALVVPYGACAVIFKDFIVEGGWGH